jgi:hypothetical protein
MIRDSNRIPAPSRRPPEVRANLEDIMMNSFTAVRRISQMLQCSMAEPLARPYIIANDAIPYPPAERISTVTVNFLFSGSFSGPAVLPLSPKPM